ncbi:hypothetical protein BKA67DRAFT_514609, partial [Truncatella angustata]
YPFPWILTAMQMAVTSIGATMMMLSSSGERLTEHRKSSNFKALAFACILTSNIVLSHTSLTRLSYLSHQIAQSSTPVFTVAFNRLLEAGSCSVQMLLPVGLLVGAIAIICSGDNQFSISSFTITLGGVLWTSMKTVMTHHLVRDKKDVPITYFRHLLRKVSLIGALQALVFAYVFGDLANVRDLMITNSSSTNAAHTFPYLLLFLNTTLAFVVNIWSMRVNSKVSPLALNVAGSLKIYLHIVVSLAVDTMILDMSSCVGLVMLSIGMVCFMAFC